MTYRKLLLTAACLMMCAAGSRADEVSNLKAQIEALQKQSTALEQQVQLLQQRIEQISAKEAQRSPDPPDPPHKVQPTSGQHGFFERKPGGNLTFYVPGGELTTYGNLDVSVDATTKGIAGEIGPDGNPPVGNMGWMPALSTNLSYIGVRGFQSLNGLPFKFIYQLETLLDISATSGTAETNSNESNVVKGGLTSRNSYIGLSSAKLGSLMLGKTYAPYKNSTARFNPFSAMIGDYQVIMANTGGDNRVEFGTLLDHSISYQSPNWSGFVIDALVSPETSRAAAESLPSPAATALLAWPPAPASPTAKAGFTPLRHTSATKM